MEAELNTGCDEMKQLSTTTDNCQRIFDTFKSRVIAKIKDRKTSIKNDTASFQRKLQSELQNIVCQTMNKKLKEIEEEKSAYLNLLLNKVNNRVIEAARKRKYYPTICENSFGNTLDKQLHIVKRIKYDQRTIPLINVTNNNFNSVIIEHFKKTLTNSQALKKTVMKLKEDTTDLNVIKDIGRSTSENDINFNPEAMHRNFSFSDSLLEEPFCSKSVAFVYCGV